MERKDRVTDWSIGIFFISLLAYVELLREAVPSIWRIGLIVGFLCFLVRLFLNSCLAYAYLAKWRYLLDLIEEYWRTESLSLDSVKEEIEKYHYTPRTTERRIDLIKSQLLAGFLLLFLFAFFVLSFEIYSNPQDPNAIIPISFLIGYYAYESVMFIRYKALGRPGQGKQSNPVKT